MRNVGCNITTSTGLPTFPKYMNAKENTFVASLDPLEADASLKLLPEMNASRDLHNIIETTKRLLPGLEEIQHYSFHQALAVARDIGMFAGSIKRHGIEPAQAIPLLSSVTLRLGDMTDMPPRNVLVHYSIWNPDGERLRTYTHLMDEFRLIENVKKATPNLENAIQDLILLYDISPYSPDFVEQCQQCQENFAVVVEAVIDTKKNVSRKVFAEEIRCYFDSILLEGKEYSSTGAVEMPLWLFDHLLWSAECTKKSYIEFKNHFVSYSLPVFRKLYAKFKYKPSLLTKICHELKIAKSANDNLLKGANALLRLFNMLSGFRKPHVKMADEVYVHNINNSRDKGSGGYHPTMLHCNIELTLNSKRQLTEAISQYKKTDGKIKK